MPLLSSLFPFLIAVVVWVAIFILIKPQRIKDLFPVGLLNAIYFFVIANYLRSTNLAFYSKGFLPAIGIVPLFAIIWAIGAAILMMNFFGQNPSKNIFVLLIFTLIALVLDVASIAAGAHWHSQRYSFIHSFLFMFAGNATFAILAVGLFKNRIYN